MQTRIEINLTIEELEDAIRSWLNVTTMDAIIEVIARDDYQFRLFAPRDSKGPWRAAWIPPRTKGTDRGPKPDGTSVES